VLSGMWAMRREAWVQLEVVSDSWNFSEEIKVRAREMFGPRYDEFHIRYAERMGETKLAPWRVGAENLAWLGMMRLGIDRQVKALFRPKPQRFAGDSTVDVASGRDESQGDEPPASSRPPVQ
jgi:hypothetical protein